MDNKLNKLAKGLTESTTQRQAQKKFGVGRAEVALASGWVMLQWARWTFSF